MRTSLTPSTLSALLKVASCVQSQVLLGSDYSLASTIRDTLKDNEIIGDVLDDFEPTWYLDVVYPEYHEVVLLGNDIPVSHVQQRPTFTIHPVNANIHPTADATMHKKIFTIALTDPDAKSRENPKWSEMCHWLITNLTSTSPGPPISQSPIILKEAGELKSYKPPGPPPKTGSHRYVFVLLEGDGHAVEAPKERRHWGYGTRRHGVRDWAADNDLKVAGANFFFAQNKKQ